MPQADRDAFLSWWDYIIKEREFKRKSRIILDSLIGDPPRFIETIPSSSSSTTVKNEYNPWSLKNAYTLAVYTYLYTVEICI